MTVIIQRIDVNKFGFVSYYIIIYNLILSKREKIKQKRHKREQVRFMHLDISQPL